MIQMGKMVESRRRKIECCLYSPSALFLISVISPYLCDQWFPPRFFPDALVYIPSAFLLEFLID
jgi:hypothetical protein